MCLSDKEGDAGLPGDTLLSACYSLVAFLFPLSPVTQVTCHPLLLLAMTPRTRTHCLVSHLGTSEPTHSQPFLCLDFDSLAPFLFVFLASPLQPPTPPSFPNVLPSLLRLPPPFSTSPSQTLYSPCFSLFFFCPPSLHPTCNPAWSLKMVFIIQVLCSMPMFDRGWHALPAW